MLIKRVENLKYANHQNICWMSPLVLSMMLHGDYLVVVILIYL